MTAFNVLAVLKAALRAAHGLEAEHGLSGYYMAIEMGNAAQSLDTIVDPEDWIAFRLASTAAMAAWLHMQAQRLSLARYRKSVRGPKKPAVKRVHDPHQPHFSVARVLKQRKTKSP